MAVEDMLGLSDDSDVVRRIREAWPSWQEIDPRLAVVGDFNGLRDWLRAAQAPVANEVLHGLAWLGAAHGGDETAASALAWALLPGAKRLVRDLRNLSPDIEALVAGQLWLEIRTFPWQRLSSVAGSILLNTRAAVLSDCGAYPAARRRRDRVWAATTMWDPNVLYMEHQLSVGGVGEWVSVDTHRAAVVETRVPTPVGYDSRPASSVDELTELLEWASCAGVISAADRLLLLHLVGAAEGDPPPRRTETCAGLTCLTLLSHVAPLHGLATRTAQRRVANAITALVSAVPFFVSEYGGLIAFEAGGDHVEAAVSADTWLWPTTRATGIESEAAA